MANYKNKEKQPMADWKKEFRRIMTDFCLRNKYTEIVKAVEKEYRNVATPKRYHGSREDFLYDMAYRKARPLIMG